MHLDLGTVTFTVVTLGVFIGLTTVFAAQSYQKSDGGLKKWGYLILFQALNWGFFQFGRQLPLVVTHFLPPILQVMTLWGFSVLLRRFLAKSPRHGIFFSLFGVLVLAQFVFVFLYPNEPYRITIVSIVAMVFSAELVLTIVYANPEIRYASHKLLAGTYGMVFGLLLIRFIYFKLAIWDLRHGLIARDQLEALTMLGFAMSFAVSAYAFMLMSKDRYFELKRRAELDEERSENEFQLLRDNVPVMIWMLNAEGEISWLNKAWLEFTGQRREKANQTDWLELIHVDDRERLRRIFETALQNKAPFHAEYRLRRRDGVFCWVLETGFPMNDADGKLTGFVGSTLDISENKQMEIALLTNEAKLRTVFDVLPVGLTVMNQNREITDFNGALLDILKVSEKDLKEGNFRRKIFQHPDGSVMEPSDFPTHTVLTTGRPVRDFEISIVHEHGEINHLLISAEPLPAPQSGVVVASRDITELKMYLKQIEALSGDLLRIAEAERAQIADELHDSLGQSLVLASLKLRMYMEGLPGITDKDKKEVLEPIKAALNTAREISYRLTPAHLKDLGVKLAVEDLVREISKSGNFRIKAELAALEDFPGGWNIDFYRIVQESLTNIMKHSAAPEIRVEAQRTPDCLEVIISNAGAPGLQGLSLLLMEHRARAFGGKISCRDLSPGISLHIEIPHSPGELSHHDAE